MLADTVGRLHPWATVTVSRGSRIGWIPRSASMPTSTTTSVSPWG